MWLIDHLAEERINEAVNRGEFDDLPGSGKPLRFSDDSLVPEELRVAYRILKNAGYLPPEAELQREIRETYDLLRAAEDADERGRAVRRLDILMARLKDVHGRTIDFAVEQRYRERMKTRFDHRSAPGGEC